MGEHMRIAIFIMAALLSGCAATKEEVTASLGNQYSGGSVDNLVAQFGPPMNSFKMASGDTAYQWELTNHTNIDVNRGHGSARTHYCRVRAIVGPDNLVRSLSTEDVSSLFGGSLCARHLGLRTASIGR